ncbi:8-oxo-dGTP pyrophosphatase MutT (NUDIX family) [Nocardioides zeae]|uniref:8-oxo-dGTP pyrophosphatase MutT (NUDIX family) n=2 Tax=Nocardioides zeae TaxID=1457234 RepID=A0ACC6IMU5_9ACTN|nr:NUDIX domain-containing protein [Nocardioides zeae]MDQ1102932.1 8-oxo-dGTP pyrophosphatase MutT (NUDIX family) [Nocardioides zeae]MDR6173333.1 8-oxo-dGTP pyrophosphatase MutT (NUDIX family) [Nocardioides zeae]MDR6211973.1 8-oxo-dGTP pyrophosphatase MutT (NUDIX family) [Nocardioides zeae]
MPVPDFIAALRARIGTAELWLPGVTAVVVRPAPRPGAREVLLVRRSDNGAWTPVTGICDPGEEPAVTARREALEETGVEIVVDRLALVRTTGLVVYPNGDRNRYLDHTFACRWVSGEAYVADDESSEVGWFALDALPPMTDEMRERIDAGASDETAARFTR